MAAYDYMAHDDPAPPVARTPSSACRPAATRGPARARTSPTATRRPAAVMTALAQLCRPQGEHREPELPRDRRRRRRPRTRLLGAGLRDDRRSGSVTPPPPPPPSDTTLPTAPGLVTATSPSSSQITLTWGPAADNVGVTGYRIYRGGVQVATTTSTTYTDSGLAASTTYSYTVRAYDAASNLGPASNTVTATTQSASAPPPPPPPTGGTTVYAGSYSLQAGSSAGGYAGNLRAQDGSTLDVAAPYGGTAAWYARFSVPRTLSALTVSYAGFATQSCTRTALGLRLEHVHLADALDGDRRHRHVGADAPARRPVRPLPRRQQHVRRGADPRRVLADGLGAVHAPHRPADARVRLALFANRRRRPE